MFKENNSNCLQISLFFIIIISMASCKKEELPKFSGDNFLYFMNVGLGNIPNPSNIHLFYVPEHKFSFLIPNGITRLQKDTLVVEKDFNALSIQSDGKLTNKKRKISLEIEGNGKEFAILPHPDSIYIPANGTEFKLNLKLVRPPLSDTGLKTLILILKNNDDFSPEKHAWNKITYNFGNLVIPIGNYDVLKEIYGDFSQAKMYALQYAVDRAGISIWNNDPNVIILNSFLRQRGEREVSFVPFDLNELYCFMNIMPISPLGPVMEANKAIVNKIISLTNVYITERKAAGKPILDELGNEIFFP